MVPKARVNFAISIGVSASPDFPPIVPLIPDIDFINDKVKLFRTANLWNRNWN